jgi:branched-chain amino acid transport system permease protein
MELAELGECLASLSCLVTQGAAGLTIGMLLFLVASGLTLIFGVLGLVNFAHGSLYMIGAYLALTAHAVTGSFALAVLGGTLGTALFGLFFERFLLSRIYGRDVLMQLLVCYAVILIMDDVVKIVWGADFRNMGVPDAFRQPPFLIGGGIVPYFYAILFAITAVIAIAWPGGWAARASGASCAPPPSTRHGRRAGHQHHRRLRGRLRIGAGWPGRRARSPRRSARWWPGRASRS